jgi:hypothetical protein
MALNARFVRCVIVWLLFAAVLPALLPAVGEAQTSKNILDAPSGQKVIQLDRDSEPASLPDVTKLPWPVDTFFTPIWIRSFSLGDSGGTVVGVAFPIRLPSTRGKAYQMTFLHKTSENPGGKGEKIGRELEAAAKGYLIDAGPGSTGFANAAPEDYSRLNAPCFKVFGDPDTWWRPASPEATVVVMFDSEAYKQFIKKARKAAKEGVRTGNAYAVEVFEAVRCH